MHVPLTCMFLLVLRITTAARYTLADDYFAGGSFFDRFSFWDAPDPTNGFVQYQSRERAQGWLIDGAASNARLMVDHNSIAPGGRSSVRITSRQSYQLGLFVVDIDHMPGGVCGTWPAFWMVGPDWPNQGEIDIIEGVNDQQTNDITLHTGPDCSITTRGGAPFSGSVVHADCTSAAGSNEGCKIATDDTQTYGSAFNAIGGGVYATEWTSTAISVYFFPRGSIPPDVSSTSLDPSRWGEPLARFEGVCDMANSFRDQQIVFDTTFCGDWAGADWPSSSCASRTRQTCEEFVAQSPQAFIDAYWSVNGLRVYQQDDHSSKISSTSPPHGSSASSESAVRPSRATSALSMMYTNTSRVDHATATRSEGSSAANLQSTIPAVLSGWRSPALETHGTAHPPWVGDRTTGVP